MIEAAMIGRDSLVGGSSALDGKVALNKGIVQIRGAASVLAIDRLRKVADASVSFRTTLIRHEQVLLVQAQQSAACNASHAVEARLARWLLRSRDLSGDDILALTQEFLAQMLGVRRTSVTLVARTLQQAGLIKYRRGKVQITDLEGLRETSCECYETVKIQYDRLLNAH
jgi:CRP-like cAMP-binding protein